MKSRYKRRKAKYRTIVFIVVIIILLSMSLAFVRNDTSAYYDTDAQNTLNLAGKKNIEVHWNEHRFIQVMHEMTHQKVKAGIKVGAVPMTKANIDKMIMICKSNKFENKDYLLGVLEKWRKGNFTMIKWEHNKLRSLSGDSTKDTIATNRSSSESEKEFINNVFKEN